MRPVESGDLTTRAKIRNVALRLFAESGFDAVSVRQIATAANVSPALVLHHFGSKDGLRQAVDQHVGTIFETLLDITSRTDFAALLSAGNGGFVAEAFAHAFPPDSPLPGYLRRLLLSGDPAGMALFRRWHEATQLVITTLVDQGLAVGSADEPLRAALLLVNDLGVVLLRDAVRHSLGVDPLSPDGLRRWAGEVTTLYRGGLWTTPPDSDKTGPTEAT
ncbi:MAG TPA: TetR/AcrR family transcriptional regulator [Pseudonocardiaceae bacterium]